MTITDDELARLEALAKAATPGPWRDCGVRVKAGSVFIVAEAHLGCDGDMQEVRANSAFIAASRASIPDLCSEVRALRQTLLETGRAYARLNSETKDVRGGLDAAMSSVVDKASIVLERDALRAENERLRAACNGSCDIALARRQVGPDAVVPGSARECAELWEQEASRLRTEAAELRASLADAVARMERMEKVVEAAVEVQAIHGCGCPLSERCGSCSMCRLDTAVDAYEASLPGLVKVGP